MIFQTLIGGTVSPVEFAPSILFATLYGLLIPMSFFRMFHKRSRTALLIPTMLFTSERLLVFLLRAVQAHSETHQLSIFLIAYMQLTFGIGFISIASNLIDFLRCLVVNATYGSDTYMQSPAAATKDGDMKAPPENTPDHPRTRFWARRLMELAKVLSVVIIICGILVNHRNAIMIGFENQKEVDRVITYRYAVTGATLLLTFVVVCGTAWTHYKLPRASKKGASLVFSIALLVTIIGGYKLSVMFHTSDSLVSTAPGTLNSGGAKATFYMFQVLPEWLASALIICVNVRKIFGTGMIGDLKYRDETPKEREKRLKREAKQDEQRSIDSDNYKELGPKVIILVPF